MAVVNSNNVVDMAALEGSKENFAPLRQGRSANKMQQMVQLADKPNELELKLRTERQYAFILSYFFSEDIVYLES
jgi:hypothetical protein